MAYDHDRKMSLQEILSSRGFEDELFIDHYKEEKPINFLDLIKLSFKLGIISFGGPSDHVEVIKHHFVRQEEYMKKHQFRHIFNLCNILPGYSSAQLLAALSTVKTRSIFSGIMAYLFFIMPSLLVLILIAYLYRKIDFTINTQYMGKDNSDTFDKAEYQILFYISVIIAGVCQASVALLINAAYSMTKKLSYSTFQLILLAFSAGSYYVFNSFTMMVVIMIICGFLSIFYGNHDYLLDISEHDFDLSHVGFIGLPCFITLIAIYAVLIILRLTYSDYPTYYLFEAFYRIGLLSFGGGHVVIPFILTEFVNNKFIEELDVMNGYAIVTLLPGPMFNISGFIGTIINGVFSGLMSALFIVLPGILICFGVLRYIEKVKTSILFQFFLRGVSSAALGFVFTAIVRLWIDSCFVNPYTSKLFGSINVLICFFLFHKYRWSVPIILLFGGFFIFTIQFIRFEIINVN